MHFNHFADSLTKRKANKPIVYNKIASAIQLLKTNIISFFIISLVLTGCFEDKKETKKESDNNAPLTILLSADYPPFEFFKNNEIVGFEVDLMRSIAKKINHTVIFKDSTFDSLIASLQTNRADMCISAISATEERKKMIDFSVPYHASQTVILTHDPNLKTPEDFKNNKVGTQMGSTYEAFVKVWQKELEGLTHQSLSKVPDLIQSLKTHRIAGIVMGMHEAKQVIRQMQSHMKDLHIIEIPNTKVDYAIALPKNSKLLTAVNQAITELEKDGTIETMAAKWFDHTANATIAKKDGQS